MVAITCTCNLWRDYHHCLVEPLCVQCNPRQLAGSDYCVQCQFHGLRVKGKGPLVRLRHLCQRQSEPSLHVHDLFFRYSSLRLVPAYDKFIQERFERCLDLYLCPRQRRMRVRCLAKFSQSFITKILGRCRENWQFNQICFSSTICQVLHCNTLKRIKKEIEDYRKICLQVRLEETCASFLACWSIFFSSVRYKSTQKSWFLNCRSPEICSPSLVQSPLYVLNLSSLPH